MSNTMFAENSLSQSFSKIPLRRFVRKVIPGVLINAYDSMHVVLSQCMKSHVARSYAMPGLALLLSGGFERFLSSSCLSRWRTEKLVSHFPLL